MEVLIGKNSLGPYLVLAIKLEKIHTLLLRNFTHLSVQKCVHIGSKWHVQEYS